MHSSACRSEAEIRRDLWAAISKADLAPLLSASASTSLRAISSIWLVLLLVLAAGHLALKSWGIGGFLMISPLLMLLVASRLHALSVQVHEGAHWLLASDKATNDLMCNWLVGYWILYDVALYRINHFQHHRHLNTPKDPEFPLYNIARKSRGDLARLTLESLVGVTALKRIWLVLIKGGDLARHEGKFELKNLNVHILFKVFAQLIVLTAFYAASSSLLEAVISYAVLWLIPLFSIFPMLVIWRDIAEHWHGDAKNGDGTFVTRTNAGRRLQDWLIGAQMEYHVEHHLVPNVPYRHIGSLHRLLRERGFYAPTAYGTLLTNGYVSTWLELMRGRRADKLGG